MHAHDSVLHHMQVEYTLSIDSVTSGSASDVIAGSTHNLAKQLLTKSYLRHSLVSCGTRFSTAFAITSIVLLFKSRSVPLLLF